jgi:hypothetical protein
VASGGSALLSRKGSIPEPNVLLRVMGNICFEEEKEMALTNTEKSRNVEEELLKKNDQIPLAKPVA